jgi:hypothetical protein
MANSKISALTSATTVVGTEVLPIVQSSATVKVSVANLTPGLGTITAAKGGTGQTSYAVGDLLYADTTTTLAKLADVATGNALISGGVSTAPSWGKIGLTTHVSGVLPVANGGTNASSAGIAAFNNITGYSASGATGTTSTNLVFSTSPSITTPTLAGDVNLSTGNITQGTAAKGINFTANTPASGMTSQLLNWYETGTWVVTVTPETSGTITLNSSFDTASYTRVGNNVSVRGQLQIGSSSLPVGTYIKISLPFAIASLAKISGRFGTTVNVDFSGTQQILFTLGVSGDAFVSAYVTASTATSPRNIWFSFSYAA